MEAIGYKSTRIRTYKGELLIIPNRDLCSRTIENYTNMPYR